MPFPLGGGGAEPLLRRERSPNSSSLQAHRPKGRDGGYGMVIQATQASLGGIRVPGLGWKLVCNLGASRSRLLDGGGGAQSSTWGLGLLTHGPRQLTKPHGRPCWPQSCPPSASPPVRLHGQGVLVVFRVLAPGLPSRRGALGLPAVHVYVSESTDPVLCHRGHLQTSPAPAAPMARPR